MSGFDTESLAPLGDTSLSELNPELLSVFNDEPASKDWKEWQKMMERANRTIGEETNLDFDWDIEQAEKRPLYLEQIDYGPLTISDDTSINENIEPCKELDPKLMKLLE